MTQKHIIRNKDFYLNTLNIEADLLKKASDIAERMMAAFMRENRLEVKVDVDDIANKIIDKMGDKLQTRVIYQNGPGIPERGGFDYGDNEPVIVKTEKLEVKGKVGKVSKSDDNISSNMDILDGLSI